MALRPPPRGFVVTMLPWEPDAAVTATWAGHGGRDKVLCFPDPLCWGL